MTIKSAADGFELPPAASLFGEPKFIIYKITNKKTKQAYIGLTSQGIKPRLAKHWRDRLMLDTLFSRALVKYGKSAFSVSILAVGDDAKSLRSLEVKLIADHKTYVRDGGYNLTLGGDGLIGASEETLAKMRAIGIKRMADPEMRARISKKVRGFKHSPEARAAISAALRKRVFSEETRAKRSKPRGPMPDYWRKKISETKKAMGATVPVWGMEKARAINTGKKMSEEIRQKLIATKNSPEAKTAASKKSKEAWARRRDQV